jgi:hypothetical protein
VTDSPHERMYDDLADSWTSSWASMIREADGSI